MYEMRDGGTKKTFGAHAACRENDPGKPAMELISPYLMIRLGHRLGLAVSSGKYPADNWKKGMDYSRCIAGILRHTVDWMLGDRVEDHLAAIVANVMFLMHYEEHKMDYFDDVHKPRAYLARKKKEELENGTDSHCASKES